MKKKLLGQKKLVQFFFSLCLLFICNNVGWSQSIFYDSFGAAAIAAPYTGGTSTPAVIYTKSSLGPISTILDANSNAYLNFNSSGTATGNQPNLTAPFAGLSSSFNTTLTNNTNLVTWTVNMRASRAMSSSTTYVDGNYYLAVVLCASNATLTGGTGSNTDGYALILQRSVDNTSGNNPGAVRLVRFHNGIGPVAGGSSISTALLATPALNSATAATITAPNNVSIKVVYNPAFDSWQLFYREDPTTAPLTFANPSTGIYTSAGTAVIDATYTSTAMTHFGFLGAVNNSTATPANQLQIDNFNINLDPLPAFTPAPTVEKRQAINNNSSTPTVNNLLAVGTGLKWYAAATGESPLLLTDPIATGIYYVTQTLSGTESDRVSTSVFVGDTSLRTLPFYENFNYTVSEKLVSINNDTFSGTGLGAWSVVPQITALSPDDMLIAAQPAIWTSSVLPTPTGNVLTFDKSGLDPQILFTAPTSGSVYASCMFMVTNLTGVTTGSTGSSSDTPSAPAQFFSLAYAPSGAGVTTSYTSAVYLKTSATAGKFNLGINAAPMDPIAAGDIIWDSNDYDINTPITLVTRYSYDDLTSKLWINPISNAIEPVAAAVTLARGAAVAVDRVRLNQAAAATTPFITLDEIRVANNWGQALGGASTLGLSKSQISELKVYPNPVSNGTLYVSSANNNEKQVAVYTILGQQVLQTKTTSGAINVSSLAKGGYILKITEDGKSETKKLIVQ